MGLSGAHPVTDASIDLAADLLRRGELVAIPTETVYGLGANALDPIAVAKVFALKGRPRFDPLIVHVASRDDLRTLVAGGLPDAARALADRFWPGPLTLVLPKTDLVPDIVTAGLPDVAVRVPDHPVAQRLLRSAKLPIAAPSANRFGRVSPTTAEHVVQSFGDECPLVLDDGPCRVGVESTVVSFVEGRPAVLRPGGVAVEEIEALVGPADRVWERSGGGEDDPLPVAPGMLASHYAPRVPLVLAEAWGDRPVVAPPTGGRWGLLCVMAPGNSAGFAAIEELAPGGDLTLAAASLFAAMRRLDAWRSAGGAPLDGILALAPPQRGLGLAIADRLRRAASR
ncbi:MAG: L-threonylcarbamoyladenylate synthase [Lacipirellulaceae bacterium]